MDELRERASKTLNFTMEECGIIDANKISKLVKRNNHGIKIMSSHIPKDRVKINDWFKQFTKWNI